MQPDTINAYWQQFLHSIPAGNEKPAGFCEAFHFADKEAATGIAALVVAGIKTATGSLLWVYEGRLARHVHRIHSIGMFAYQPLQ